jgi:predicted amidohydrolase YtcJ
MKLSRRRFITGTAATSLATALSLRPTEAAEGARTHEGPADLLILNGQIVTLNPASPTAEAVLIRNGRIQFVGTAAEAKSIGRGVRRYDAAGRTVLPGFIDGHTHIEAFSESLDFQYALARSLRSLSEMLSILKQAVSTTPSGRWIIGRGFFNVPGQVVEKRMPTREELDSVSMERPVALFSSPHICSLNTAAFKALGAWTEDDEKALKWRDGSPVHGLTIHRNGDGVPTGVAVEAQELIWALQPYTLAERVAAYSRHAQQDYVSKGISSLTLISGSVERVAAISKAYDEGLMPLRARRFSLVPQAIGFDDVVRRDGKAGSGNDMLRFGGIKIFVDGAGQDGLGAPYDDVKWTLEDLSDMVTRCTREGYPTIMHVVTLSGLNLALAAHAEAQRRTPVRLRHRLDHLPFLNDAALIARMKELSLGAGLTRAQRGDGRPHEAPDFRALLNAGIAVQAVSDSAGSFRDFSPMAGIASLVAPVDEGGTLPPGKTVTLDEALRMYTTTAAWAAYEERDKGTIEVGKLADFAILSGNPLQTEAGKLFDIEVDEVIVGGRSRYRHSQSADP